MKLVIYQQKLTCENLAKKKKLKFEKLWYQKGAN